MDYLITEAVAIKANREDAKAHEDAVMKQRKKEAQEELKRMFPAQGR